MRDIDPLVWFGEREVTPTPKHFIRTTTTITNESMMWIITKLKGRYSVDVYQDISSISGIGLVGNDFSKYPYFEDPAEAMIYELRWAGSK